MLLIIENKDDPAGEIAVDLEDFDGTELAYIPVVTVRLNGEPQQVRLGYAIDAMSFEWRKKLKKSGSASGHAGELVGLYLKAMLHAGILPPDPAQDSAARTPPKAVRFRARG